jgi:hypothetical protein
MANGTVDAILNPGTALKDSSQVRLQDFTCVIFTGAQAPQRISKYIREYVNAATYNNGDKLTPSNYSITDQGLPSALLHTIYFSDGIWYLFFNNHAPYNATAGSEFPFNQIPDPSDTGYIL